jgi:hypothetical protein
LKVVPLVERMREVSIGEVSTVGGKGTGKVGDTELGGAVFANHKEQLLGLKLITGM